MRAEQAGNLYHPPLTASLASASLLTLLRHLESLHVSHPEHLDQELDLPVHWLLISMALWTRRKQCLTSGELTHELFWDKRLHCVFFSLLPGKLDRLSSTILLDTGLMAKLDTAFS